MSDSSLIPKVWEIPNSIRLRLGASAGHQRVIAEDGHVLLVLHKPPGPDQPQREAALFWRKPDGQWLSDQHGSGIGSLEEHLASYVEAIDQVEEDERIAASADAFFSVLDRIAPIFRASSNLHQVLQEARRLCNDDHDLINHRDRAYEIQRRSELLYNGTKNSLDFAVAKRAEEQAIASHKMAVAAHRLNLLAGFFFPIATCASILGVNLAIPYENETSYVPFFLFLGGGLMFGFILAMLIFSPSRKPQT